MTRILVDPDQLRSLSTQFERVSQDLKEVAGRVNNAWSNLDLRVRQQAAVGGQVSEAFNRGHALAREAMVRANYLLTKAQAFEEADGQGVADLNDVIRKHPVPLPTPTPIPDPGPEDGEPVSVRDAIERLDDLLKPIDWVSDHKKSAKAFRETLEQIGRLLNAVTGKRGHIKLMRELGDVLTGATKSVSAASDLLALRDFRKYFAGEINNQEIARTAIEALIPIPFIDDKIADWLAANVPDPTGKWHGLVPKAY